MSEGFGVPKFGGSNFSNNYVKSAYMKDQAPVTGRLIPPVGENAASGTWQVYYGTHFGFYGVGREGKRALRLFKCIERTNFKTKMKEVECPVCNKLESIKARIEAEEKVLLADAEAEFNRTHDQAKLANAKEAVKERMKNDPEFAPFVAWAKEHNVSRNWHTYIMSPEGEFFDFQTSHKTNKLLVGGKAGEVGGVIAEARAEGTDPFDVNGGCWFVWTRTGRWTQAQDTVKILDEVQTMNGVRVKLTKPAPMTLEQQQAALKLPNLHHNTKSLTAEQIQALADLPLSPDPEEVDAIFGYSQRADEPEVTESAPVQGFTAPSAPAVPAPASFRAPEPAIPTTKTQAEIMAAVAELQQKATAKPAEASSAVAAASAPTGADNRARLEAMFKRKP